MLISIDTDKPLSKLETDIPKACGAHQFGVLGVHNLKQKMLEKGVDYAGDCLIFEVCNPMKAKQVLENNPEISTSLPCRIAVFRTREGRTRLSTLRPTALIEMYRAPGLGTVAAEVEATLIAIMKESAA